MKFTDYNGSLPWVWYPRKKLQKWRTEAKYKLKIECSFPAYSDGLPHGPDINVNILFMISNKPDKLMRRK